MSPHPGGPRYVPAAGRRGLTRLYDTVLATTMRESAWRAPLIARLAAELPQAGTVADVGAGTGTLAIALAARRPDAQVLAVDGDPEALELAQAKPGAHGVRWQRALADELPLEDAGAHAVVMSLVLHHLDRPAKARALAEARRVLRPGGRLHIADWGQAHDPVMRAAFGVLQLIDGVPGTRDHAAGLLPALVVQAGFSVPERSLRLRTGWGSLELLHADAPG